MVEGERSGIPMVKELVQWFKVGGVAGQRLMKNLKRAFKPLDLLPHPPLESIQTIGSATPPS